MTCPIIIAVAGAKGGTAKTTTAVTLSAELAARGSRITLVDCDPQSSATASFHLEPITDRDGPLAARPSLVLLPSPSGELSFRLLRGGRRMEEEGTDAVRRHLERAGAESDVVVADTCPSLQPSLRACLRSAHLLIVPLSGAWMELRGLVEIVAVARALSPSILVRAVFTREHRRHRLTREIVARVEALYPGLAYRTRIPQDVRVAESPFFGLPVTLYAPTSRAAVAYRSLASEVLDDICSLGTAYQQEVHYVAHS
jgi:chromosome partitioning protein